MTTAKRFDKYGDYVYPAVRIVVGFLFACHGAQKLLGVLGSQPEIHDPEGLVAGLVEFFGGSLVALGLGARVAAFLASGEMAIAYFKAHAPRGFWPILNGGEKAVFYCFFSCTWPLVVRVRWRWTLRSRSSEREKVFEKRNGATSIRVLDPVHEW